MFNIIRLIIISVCLVLFGWSQQPVDNKKPADSPCAKATTTLETNQCFANLEHEADAGLNALYQKIEKLIQARISQEQAPLKAYQERSLAKLKAAEVAWLHYRDAQCEAAEQQFEGGTISTSVRLGCLKDLTDQRSKELQQTYAIYLHGAP
jgi:uncharacterized protein YecT (DUF1311 family)